MPTLALLDGHSLAYRAFYALPEDLRTSSGQVTNSVYGFTSMLVKLLDDHHPDVVAVAWDTPVPTFRKEAYQDYKAQRAKAPDEFRNQIPLIKEVVESLGFEQLAADGFEADDVIATVAREAERRGWRVLVVTGDRDSFQLIDNRITVLYTRRGISDVVAADAAWVQDRYGITPERYVEYAALRGDPSDNLPGVPGVGEKTAARLITKYGSIDGIYEHLDEMTPKLHENLVAARDQVYLNRDLMRLREDVPVDLSLDVQARSWDRERAEHLFESLEFRVLWDRLESVEGGQVVGDAFEVAVDEVGGSDELAPLIDRDALVVEPVEDREDIVGVMLVTAPDRVVHLPADRVAELAAFFDDRSKGKIMHDAKPFIRSLIDRGMSFDGLTFDTALAAYLINPAARDYSLPTVTSRYLHLDLGGGSSAAQGTLDFGGGPDLELAARRAVAVSRLEGALTDELSAREQIRLLTEIELPLVRVLARMEHVGIGVDRRYLTDLGAELRAELADLERAIHEAAGHPFNINSTSQLRTVIFDELGLPVLKKTPKGAPSTDHSVLMKLGEAHPIVSLLLRYREIEKLRSTYVDGYLPLIDDQGRIHTRFNQMGSATGRLSSDRPNLQNIPVRSDLGRTIRRAFIPRAGWKFFVADYSQIELRVLAHLSGAPGLVEIFRRGDTDVHTETAARLFELDAGEVSSEMRRRAKGINFGLLYGMEAYGLADRLGISREEAAEHIDAYFSQFPEVQAFLQSLVAEARARGYTETLFGRRRYLQELTSDNFRVRQMGERMALNAPVQGTAADIIKKAMIDLHEVLAPMRTELLLQIHDELVVEAPEEEWPRIGEILRTVMEGVVNLDVPLRVDLAEGFDLAACKT